MNKTTLLILFLLLNLALQAQNNALLLQKSGATQKTYFAGHFLALETKQGNYADGIITRITNDSIYLRHFDIEKSATQYGGVYFDTAFRYTTAIHIKDIGALPPKFNTTRRKRNGTILIVAGVGVMALGAINGVYRGDPPREWYQPSSYIVSGALIGLGLLSNKSSKKKIRIGKKYTLKILPLAIR